MSENNNAFSTPADVLKMVTDMERAMLPRGRDRARMDAQFNGDRPFTEDQERELQIQINSNFLEGFNIAKNGILQTNTALLYKDELVRWRLLDGKPEKRNERASYFTANFNRPLKRGQSSIRFVRRMQNRNIALTGHGIGSLWWPNSNDVLPCYASLDDLLIPTDTTTELQEDTTYFGLNGWLTPYRLYEMSRPDNAQPGWDQKQVSSILSQLRNIQGWNQDYWNFYLYPEKAESLWKQHAIYLNSDSVPKVKITNFYHQDPTTGKWWRKVIVRAEQTAITVDPDTFIYNGTTPFADNISQILHIQFGDNSVVAPAKYHSVRGLFVPLYSPVELMNRLRCQFAEHVFQNLVPLISLNSPIEEGRPLMLRFQQYGVVPNGVQFVNRENRHQVDPRMVNMAMSEFRQLMAENSSSYVQDVDTGTQREQTLGEAQIKLQTANRIVSSMLQGAFEQEIFLYEEMKRRMLLPTTTDPVAKKFQEDCRRDGIPDELMKPECWEASIPKPYGMGDQTLAQQEVSAVMQMYPRLDATAQRKATRDFITVMGRSPDRAKDLVPEEMSPSSGGRRAAEDVFGTLMLGVPVAFRDGIEQRDYVEAMMQMLNQKIQQLETMDNTGTVEDVIGMSTVISDLEAHIQFMAQDPANKEFTTAAGKGVGVLTNKIKGFAQRVAEKQQAEDPQDPEKLADAQATMMKAETDMKAKQAKGVQALEQKEAMFQLKQEQQAIAFQNQQQQSAMKFQQEMEQLRARTMADLEAMRAKTISDIEAQRARAAADIASMQAKASVSSNTDKSSS